MLKRNHPLVEALVASLESEARHQRQYIALVQQEKEAVVKFRTDDVKKLSKKREDLTQKILSSQRERIEIVKKILKEEKLNLNSVKITKLADTVMGGKDRERVKKAAAILKELISISKNKTKELEGIVGFSMKLVSGSLSAIVSATYDLNTMYMPNGRVKRHQVPVARSARHIARTA
ncbi:MAG: hypothetical protein D6808_01625 [Candidatus Dadabacteria bacterium]|nr:MAG: hypothetical protein D6808_01625 [Candidatus Dadabacteria bacterium]